MKSTEIVYDTLLSLVPPGAQVSVMDGVTGSRGALRCSPLSVITVDYSDGTHERTTAHSLLEAKVAIRAKIDFRREFPDMLPFMRRGGIEFDGLQKREGKPPLYQFTDRCPANPTYGATFYLERADVSPKGLNDALWIELKKFGYRPEEEAALATPLPVPPGGARGERHAD